MALLFQEHPFSFSPEKLRLRQKLIEAKHHLGEAVELSPSAEMVMPVPVYVANSHMFAAGRTRAGIRFSGWRGLVTDNGSPIAIVEISEGAAQDEVPSINIRGAEPAIAFHKTIIRVLEEDSIKNEKYEVAFLNIPGIYVTALWLKGRRSIYVPTRLGKAERPDVIIYNRIDFIKTVRKIILRLQENKNSKIKRDPESVGNNPPNPLIR